MCSEYNKLAQVVSVSQFLDLYWLYTPQNSILVLLVKACGQTKQILTFIMLQYFIYLFMFIYSIVKIQ